MPDPILHKYIDGFRSFASVTFSSGERALLSLAQGSFAMHRLHLRGLIPGKRLFVCPRADAERVVRVLLREPDLPELPQAVDLHKDETDMAAFLEAATADIEAVARGEPAGRVDALQIADTQSRPLAVLTRCALASADAADCVRRFERARNIPG